MHQFDLDFLQSLNHFISVHPYLLKLVRFLGDDPLPRGMPVFATLTFLWFSSSGVETRSRILTGFLATSIALAFSLVCQHVLAVHLRPIFDPNVEVTNFLRWGMEGFHKRHYSFPSDTTVLYFGLATTVFIINRSAGIANYVWCCLAVGVCRVALGVHYPSDIVAGMALGAATVLLADRLALVRRSILAATKAFDRGHLIANTAFVLFMLEAYSLFPGVQAIFSNIMQLMI